ncbi:TPA: transposase [Escherichia coli]|uniref:transposase n=2 Tax=Enterobacteriaceae TaxID=543 RepID=UPI000E2A5099|nr:transposase [Escherichia coli]EIX1889955.1 transposase [Escherichia coli]SVF31887.1 IS66 transposase [Escherichia coli]HAL2220334.1 transposase [Escherichia coli]HAN6541971.1 transposase [Escherichia coli]HAU8063246.1 transposase [Escherichia coli]
MEPKTLSAEPRRSVSNEFKLQMVKLALQLVVSVVRIAREHDINDNLLFKWLRLWQNEGRVLRRLQVTTSSDTGVELLPVEITPDEQKEPMATLPLLLSTPSQSTASASSCKVEFHYGKTTLKNPSPELLTVLLRELSGRGQ